MTSCIKVTLKLIGFTALYSVKGNKYRLATYSTHQNSRVFQMLLSYNTPVSVQINVKCKSDYSV